jgi:geranylgeranyl diphosphate synthase, type II
MDLDAYLALQSDRTVAWLDRLVPPEDAPPGDLHRAMRYSLFAGGKRLRPALCIAAGELFDAEEAEVLPVACALEMIHTYSLVHDDLPAMDDDDLRRGRPTCHTVFGEAMAILSGDALLTNAFRVLADVGVTDRNVARRMRIIGEISRAAGSADGMVGGQVLDLAAEGQQIAAEALDRMHEAKTGALLTASVVTGAIAGGAGEPELERLGRFGRALGLAFQIADDVLDVTATEAELGKTPGKDRAAHKATYPALYGIDGSLARARGLADEAVAALEGFGPAAGPLREIACFVVERRK